MPVPLLDLNLQNLALEPELQAAFTRVLRSGQFILGPDVGSLEAELKPLTGTEHTIGVSSGTDAILLALMALGIGPGDEVLCPSFTFFATAGCVARVGAKPVFVDSCPGCFNIDTTDARRKVTSATRAIIPVHLFGQSADMDPILALAREKNLRVIEDAAQALGASYKGRKVGSMGEFGTYSFFPTKNFGAFGDAGLLATHDGELAEKARILRVHGSRPKYVHRFVGANFRLDTLQAALLRVKTPYIASYNEKRRANAAYYSERLRKLPQVEHNHARDCCSTHLEPSSVLKAILPGEQADRFHIWNQYTIRFPGAGRRDKIKQLLSEKGIVSEIYYPIPLHQQECFSRFVTPANACRVAETLANEVLSIPIYPELSRAQQDEVIEALTRALTTI